MPDELDYVQDRVLRDTQVAIDEAVRRREPRSQVCVDCGGDVEPQRFTFGCCRCFECQRRHEAREKQFGRGR